MTNSKPAAAIVASIATIALASTAGAAPTAVDIDIHIGAGPTVQRAPLVPTGGRRTVAGLTFYITVNVGLVVPEPARARFRLELPNGLSWGADRPNANERCTSTASTVECETRALDPTTVGVSDAWFWSVAAIRTGRYVLNAEIIEMSATDQRPADNATFITVEVTEGVTASAARLTSGRPKAGSLVRVRVRVTAGGPPIKPAGVACSGTLGSAKLTGTPKAARGTATCSYRTPKAAKGKTLKGAISFWARGKRFTKRFSARLG